MLKTNKPGYIFICRWYTSCLLRGGAYHKGDISHTQNILLQVMKRVYQRRWVI